MSYDEWEAVRIVKSVAALKLMRRYPPVFATRCLSGMRLQRKAKAQQIEEQGVKGPRR